MTTANKDTRYFIMWRQRSDLGAEGTKFRPNSITTLIFFYIGRFFGRLFGRRSR